METHTCPDIEAFKKILKKHSLKATPQRIAVHEVMMDLGHASVDMVADALKQRTDIKITLASVYNVLTQMAMLGVYHYRLSSNNKMYFDVNVYEHAHFYDCCENSYEDFNDPELVKMVMEYVSSKKIDNFDIKSVDIQLVGRKVCNNL